MIGDTTGLPTGNEGGGATTQSSTTAEALQPITLNKNRLVTIGPDGRPHESYTSPFVLLDTINYAKDLCPKVRPTRYMPTEEIIEFLTFIGAAMLASNAVPKNVRRHYGHCAKSTTAIQSHRAALFRPLHFRFCLAHPAISFGVTQLLR